MKVEKRDGRMQPRALALGHQIISDQAMEWRTTGLAKEDLPLSPLQGFGNLFDPTQGLRPELNSFAASRLFGIGSARDGDLFLGDELVLGGG